MTYEEWCDVADRPPGNGTASGQRYENHDSRSVLKTKSECPKFPEDQENTTLASLLKPSAVAESA